MWVEIERPDGGKEQVEVPEPCLIGRGPRSELRLEGWLVSREHARLCNESAGLFVEDIGGLGGVTVNGVRIEGLRGPLDATDVIGIAGYRLRLPGLSHGVQEKSPAVAISATSTLPASPRPASLTDPIRPSEEDLRRRQLEAEWRRKLHARLLETMDLRRHDVHGMSDEDLRKEASSLLHGILEDEKAAIPAEIDRAKLGGEVLDEAIGLGPLEALLADDEVTEIMVNRFDEIYIERGGRLLPSFSAFTGNEAVLGVIERIVAPLGRRIDESSPMVDARLKDGSRVNAIIPPLALKGPCVTIRKFARRKLGAGDLVGFGSMNLAMATFLEVCVLSRKNIIVSGGTGSGKTTLLNILSNFIPGGERVITVEDAAELKLHHEHLVSLEARPANVEGKGAVSIRDLVRNSLRMRPDRIVVGECRGAEALDMLQAMNTGHEGSLTTLHANSPRDGLARLEIMILMAGMDLPLAAIREQISSAVDIVVQQTRFPCGSRKVTSITEVTGMESGKIQMQELFRFMHQGYGPPEDGHPGRVKGRFTACDIVPGFYEALEASGVAADRSIFHPGLMEGADPQTGVDE